MLENNIAIVVSCMPAFAVFLKQIVFETSIFKSLRSALASSRKDSQDSASFPKKFASLITFGGGGAKKARPKQGNEDTRFDSYIELNDASQSRTYSTGQQIEERNSHAKMPESTASGTYGTEPASPEHSLPQDAILRTTEVEQNFCPVPSEKVGRSY